MDYGHFTVTGSTTFSRAGLLEKALLAPPSISDGATVIVLSPHQNNFALPLSVEVWSAAPDPDPDDWQQVSQERLTVDERRSIYIESPTLDGVSCPLSPGEYVVETSGRGFVAAGWPGSVLPADDWRIRIWPESESEASWPAPKVWKP
jgi:hypothetical protein